MYLDQYGCLTKMLTKLRNISARLFLTFMDVLPKCSQNSETSQNILTCPSLFLLCLLILADENRAHQTNRNDAAFSPPPFSRPSWILGCPEATITVIGTFLHCQDSCGTVLVLVKVLTWNHFRLRDSPHKLYTVQSLDPNYHPGYAFATYLSSLNAQHPGSDMGWGLSRQGGS